MFGVEPCEVKNMLIYFKYGFTNFIKAVHEKEPAKNENEEPRDVLVDYYLKDLNIEINEDILNNSLEMLTDIVFNPLKLEGKLSEEFLKIEIP